MSPPFILIYHYTFGALHFKPTRVVFLESILLLLFILRQPNPRFEYVSHPTIKRVAFYGVGFHIFPVLPMIS